MRLCGITSRFQLLSPCMRQVTHALLTRPPLSHKRLQTEVICLKCFVRLACVKHAASVHPEPGSNSYVKVLFLASFFWLTPVFLNRQNCLFSIRFRLLELTMGCVYSYPLFSFQGSICFSAAKIILSNLHSLVKYLF